MTLQKAPFRHTVWRPPRSRHILSPSSPRRSRTFVSSQDPLRNRDLFEYTSGRWLYVLSFRVLLPTPHIFHSYNEPLRLSERQLLFNDDDFQKKKKSAASSINKSASDMTSFRKLAEGGFNRVFNISMKDDSSILACLPYSPTLSRRLTVASEVATSTFARSHGIPAPRALGYSVGENDVGPEYVMMEKVPGKPTREEIRSCRRRTSYKLDRSPLGLELSSTLVSPQSGNDKVDVITHSGAGGLRFSLPRIMPFSSREPAKPFKCFIID
jgi:hypothetical protein